jgi:hypothetical protein
VSTRMNKLLLSTVLLSIASLAHSSIKSSIEIKAMFQECQDSEPVPMGDVSIIFQLDDNAAPEDFLCESKVDNRSGIAKCFVTESCSPSPVKLYNQVKIMNKKHFNLSVNTIELVVEQCNFIKPPVFHEVTFRHSQCPNYDKYVSSVSLLQVSKNSLINFSGEDKVKLLTAISNDKNNMVERTVKDALNLAKVYRDSAKLFAQDSDQYNLLKEKENYFAQNATLIMNTSIFNLTKDQIPDIVASSSLSDYYNNMNKLRANQLELLNIVLPSLDIFEQESAKLKVERLVDTKELDFEAINALNAVKSISY